MVKPHYRSNLKHFARELRKQGTLAEVLLWQQLKGRKIRGYQFTRQKPIGQYIVDFYCPRLGLAIEIDGISHDDKRESDQKRQADIERQGVRFLRFFDSDVKQNLAGVVAAIDLWIEENADVPPPPPRM